MLESFAQPRERSRLTTFSADFICTLAWWAEVVKE
jgi:hypothetical protein